MQFTQKSRENMDSCRFCWMCRHICPIGNATGLERNTSRARALGLSLVDRKAIEYSDDIISNVYECALCGACVKECVTGWDPVLFTKEARLGAALEGKLPAYVMKMIENFNEKGNIYGKDEDASLKSEIAKLKESDTCLFLGCDARYVAPLCSINAINLLKRANEDFSVLQNEPDSGFSFDFLIGKAAETKEIMEKCAKELSSFKRVICYDSADAKIMKREYREWGIDMKCEVLSFTEYLSSLIKNKKLNPKKSDSVYTPQDSFHLARDLEETEPFREILLAMGNVREMLLNRKDTFLAGHLIMNEYMPDVIKRVAEDRWRNALNVKAEKVITTNVAEYVIMKKTKPENVELYSIEEAVLKCL